MTKYITQEQVVTIAPIYLSEHGPYAKEDLTNLCSAAIQSYIDQQAKELPELPEPNVPEGDWFERDCYIKSYAQAYGQQCAAHAREKALEEVSDAINDLSYDASRLDCRIAIEALKKAR